MSEQYLLVEPNRFPTVINVSKSDRYAKFEELVGVNDSGVLDYVCDPSSGCGWIYICSNPHISKGREFNRIIRDSDGKIVDRIYGSFIVAVKTGESIASLPEQDIKTLSNKFYHFDTQAEYFKGMGL